MEVKKEEAKTENILIVYELHDLLPKELLRLPLNGKLILRLSWSQCPTYFKTSVSNGPN